MLRIIGDIHQNYGRYFDAVADTEYSIQVGDLGFNYGEIRKRIKKGEFDPTKHKVIAGNHDNYSFGSDDYFRKQKFFLSDFGVCDLGGVEFFFVRGEWSIDHKYRTYGFDWWIEEQIDQNQVDSCIELYRAKRPSVVITHGCPFSIVPHVTNPEFARSFGYFDPIKTRTNQLLETLFQIHRPDLWFFGHYHTSWSDMVNGTEFYCLNIGEVYDLR